MNHVVVRHRIKDYIQWKAVFDETEDLRHRYGLGRGWIHRGINDPNELVVTLEFQDIAKVQEFFECEELREAMNRGGVVGEPEIMYLELFAEVPEMAAKRP